jgi:hypothetical protein
MSATETTAGPGEPVLPEGSTRPMRTLLHAISLSVLILTGTVFVFIYRQVVLVRRQTAEYVRFLAEYERSNASEFIARAHRDFAQFRRQHPDFNPIYLKYFGTNEPPPAPAPGGGKVGALPGKANP